MTEASPAAPARLVLVIDDGSTFRTALAGALAGAGYATAVAGSGPEGLRLAATQRPAAIIVGGVLPEMDGARVIRRVRLDPMLRTTPCVLLTGSGDAVAGIHALEAGADAFMDKGSDIELILARLGAVLRAARAEPAGPAGAVAPRRILAVDDSAGDLHALAELLREEGYDVAQATSGEEALDLLAVQHVDCILLDRMMPGLSAIETCARIKAAPVVRDIPLILLAAVEDRDAMLEGFAAGADDFVARSSGLDVLEARISAQLRRKQFEDEHRSAREQVLRSEHEAAKARVASELAETHAVLVDELERSNDELASANRELAAANRDLEAFSYSVSHDLRAKLRSINAFTRALEEDAGDRLDAANRDHLDRVIAATIQMSELLDALLGLSRVGRARLVRSQVDLSALAIEVIEELRERDPEREVEVTVHPGLRVCADGKLMRIVLDNILGNAWKFTSRRAPGHIEIGGVVEGGQEILFVRDDGAGFDPANAARLFTPFQRLHSDAEFAGTGIGLATVQRIIERHGGGIWAESEVGAGATFYFTVPASS